MGECIHKDGKGARKDSAPPKGILPEEAVHNYRPAMTDWFQQIKKGAKQSFLCSFEFRPGDTFCMVQFSIDSYVATFWDINSTLFNLSCNKMAPI